MSSETVKSYIHICTSFLHHCSSSVIYSKTFKC